MRLHRRPLLLLLLAPLSGPAFAAGADVVGSGRLQGETRPLAAFEAIALRGPITATLRQTGRAAVELRADDNLLPLIETRVVDRAGVATLEIGPREQAEWRSRHGVHVDIELASLRALSIAGSGDARSDGLTASTLTLSVTGTGRLRLKRLSADTLAVRLSGSGDVSADGRAARLTISIAGSGDVDTRGLACDDVEVSIAGSGNASVHAGRTLAVAIKGSGDVRYAGEPALNSSIAGSGTVRRR